MKALQPLHQQLNTGGGGLGGLIDVQVNAAAQLPGQLQQGVEVRPIAPAAGEGRTQNAAQQSTRGGHPPRQGQALTGAPLRQRREGDQLELNSACPALLQLEQGLPAGLSAGTTAIDMTAQPPQAVAPGPLKGPLTALQHLLSRTALPLLEIQGQGRLHPAAVVGELRPTEGLIEVDMGVHQWRQRQGQA